MDSDIAQNTTQCAYFKVFMSRDSDVVFAFYTGGKSYVTAGLPGYFIAVFLRSFASSSPLISRGSFILLLLHLLRYVSVQYGEFPFRQSGIL